MPGGQGTSENAQLNFMFGLEVDGVTIAFVTKVGGLGASRPVVENNVTSKQDKKTVIQKIPGNLDVNDLTVSRGLTDDKAFTDWRAQVVDGAMDDARKNGAVVAYDHEAKPVAKWEFTNAWPSKWEIGELQAGDTGVVAETLTLAIESIKRTQ